MNLGTVLPSKAFLSRADRFAEEQIANNESIGDILLPGTVKRFIQGETRWYKQNGAEYAVVGRHDQKIKWFRVGLDGDRRI